MTPDRKAKARRLERAGYVSLAGWVPAAYGKRVLAQVEMHREDVARVLAEPPKPRGRPKKS